MIPLTLVSIDYNPSLPSESDNEKDTTFSLRNETSAYEKEDETWIHPVDGNNEKDEAFELRYESVETKRDDTWVHLLGLSLFKNFSFIAVCLAMACFCNVCPQDGQCILFPTV